MIMTLSISFSVKSKSKILRLQQSLFWKLLLNLLVVVRSLVVMMFTFTNLTVQAV